MTLTPEEIKNIIILINKAPLTGVESITVALLLQKLNDLLPKAEPTKEKKT